MSGLMKDVGDDSRKRDKELHDKIDEKERHIRSETDRVHLRVDDVREQYVRRDDFRIAIDRIEIKLDKVLEGRTSG